MENLTSLYAMIVSDILIILMIIMLLRKKDKSQLKTAFLCWLSLVFIWILGSILQILFQNTDIDPFLFEKFAGIGVWFSPVAFLAIGIIFSKSKLEFKWYHLLFLIIPITTGILSFTNEYHHLVFKYYTPHIDQMVYGDYFMIHSIYTYVLYIISIVYLLKYSIKNSGFFSKQSILLVIGILVPLLLNLFGTMGIIKITTYTTPISFALMAIIYSLAIFKFDFINVVPIALQKIVDRMSDSYIVLNEKNIITDFNETFLKTFHLQANEVRNKKFFELLKNNKIDAEKFEDTINKARHSSEIFAFERHFKNPNKYFNIEISRITNKRSFLGTLILFKDITQHMLDMQTIKNNQDILMERERLASLGQLIGGIAHNLKTPIMSISGAVEGLEQLIDEYDTSIDDPLVNSQDHHDIAKDMRNWLPKIRTHIEYMSDIITTVKGQAVALSNQEDISFTIGELIKRVNILMKHELKNAYIYLNIMMKTDENISLNGDINSLVQVVNNMISNAIQAYNGKHDQNIELEVNKDEKNVIFSVRDFAGGLPKEVQEKLFKEMVTTKGKNGTGLGLYMSYSNIKARFGGDITFETVEGKGTTFNIIIPIK